MAKKKIKRLSGTFLAQNETLKLTKGKNRSLKVASVGRWPLGEQPRPLSSCAMTGPSGPRRAPVPRSAPSSLGPHLRGAAQHRWNRHVLLHVARGRRPDLEARCHLLGRRGSARSGCWPTRVRQSLNWTLAGTAAVEIASIPGLSGYLLAKGALVETVPFDATDQRHSRQHVPEIPLGFGRDL